MNSKCLFSLFQLQIKRNIDMVQISIYAMKISNNLIMIFSFQSFYCLETPAIVLISFLQIYYSIFQPVFQIGPGYFLLTITVDSKPSPFKTARTVVINISGVNHLSVAFPQPQSDQVLVWSMDNVESD